MSPHFWEMNERFPKLAGRAVDSGTLILHGRSWKSPMSPSSALYIFLGILITLVISAPLLALLRSRQRHALQNLARALQKAERNAQDRQTELGSLLNVRETLAEVQQEHRLWCRDNETLLEEERERLKKTKLQVDELKRDQQELMRTKLQVDALKRDQRKMGETVRNLEEQLGLKDGRLADMKRNLADMQTKYEFVNQEYHSLRDRAPS